MPCKIKMGLLICMCSFLAGCVTNIDPSLPQTQLEEVTLASEIGLAVSPSHPTNLFPFEPIPAGTKLGLIAVDNNSAYLLVQHQDKIGWIPTFFSKTGTGRVEPPVVIKPLDGSCTQYMGAIFEPDESWVSNTSGSIIVEGTIFRPKVGDSFSQASLQANITGPGKVVSSDYLHLPLTQSSNIIFFAFAIEKVTQKSTVQFVLNDVDDETLSFQATFFADNCGEDRSSAGKKDLASLAIGQIKTTLPTKAPTPTSKPRSPSEENPVGTPDVTPNVTPTAIPTKIVVTSGPRFMPPTREEIKELLDLWDEIHHEVDRTLNPSRLPEVLTGGALRQQEQTLKNLKAGSCYWQFTDLSPSQITDWQEISVNEVIVTMDKHWDGRVYCKDVLDKKSSFSDPFSVRYQIVRTNQGWRIAEKVPLDSGVIVAPPKTIAQNQPTPVPPAADSSADQLYTHLLSKSRNSRISVAYSGDVERFVDTLVYRLNEFQLPREGITQQTMTDLLYQGDIGDRLNGLIQEVWKDWLGIASKQKLDPYRATPQNRGLSAYRVLVIRMVQGTQGRFSAAEQRALYNYFSRWEDPSVWSSNVKGVIAAINRENFR